MQMNSKELNGNIPLLVPAFQLNWFARAKQFNIKKMLLFIQYL